MKYLAEMTFVEVRDLGEDAVAILPVGAIEAHGPHLPIQTDVIIARAMAKAGAHALEAGGFSNVVIAPTIQLTSAGFASGFAGTMSLSPAVLTAVVVEAAQSLRRAGFAHIVLANSHLDPAHIASLHEAVRRSQEHDGIRVTFPDITRKPWASRLTAEFKSGACHAGRYETSMVMAERPDLVRDSIRVALAPNPASLSVAIREGKKTFEEAGGPSAYFGFPADASAEEGRETIATLGAILAEALSASKAGENGA
jgi:creatinine amidohydrolase